jgi:nicotinamide-nucleotide amidase
MAVPLFLLEPNMTQISLITIGDELLKGRIVNTNAAQAGLMLRKQGYSLNRVVVISDNREAILETVRQELDQHEVVIMCGGLGPTDDDITKSTLAKFFQTELVWHEPTLQYLREREKKRGRELNERTQKQAFLPADAEILFNPKGSAPGMCFRQRNKRLYSLPGVPFEMLYLLEHEVIPRLQEHHPVGFFDHRIVRLNGLPESKVALLLDEVKDQLAPAVSLAFLPRNDGLWLELSIRDRALKAAMERNQRIIAETLAENVYTLGGDPLTQMVGELLAERQLTIAVAESLTGGNVSAKLVSVAGSSRYFKGSVVAYSEAVKQSVLGVDAETLARHTVVSEAVALEMAEGVRRTLGADIGLATTGIAQPGEEERPRAWLAYADGQKSKALHVYLLSDRAVNIDRASERVLQLCWEELH